MVSAWPEPPSARPAEPPAGVCDGWDIFAFGTSERHRTAGRSARRLVFERGSLALRNGVSALG
jgi:hypothetical protein